MNQEILARKVRERFTPLAFSCDCNGTDPACARIRQTDVYAIAQAETTDRIARFIQSYDARIESVLALIESLPVGDDEALYGTLEYREMILEAISGHQ